MHEQLDLLKPESSTALHSTMYEDQPMNAGIEQVFEPVERHMHDILRQAPYGIHGNKFPGVIWPDPKKMQFAIVRDYDPMHMGNRDKALHLSAYRESPRRRRSDVREAED